MTSLIIFHNESVVYVTDNHAEAENFVEQLHKQLDSADEDIFTIDATAANSTALADASEFLTDAIAHQSKPHASIFIADAQQHLENIVELLKSSDD